MRLWSLHPKYLDVKGLTAVWREGLLAQAVLRGRTQGYRNHPQLARFREHGSGLAEINAYLWFVYVEAKSRGYTFDRGKVRMPRQLQKMAVRRGQVAFEAGHLRKKLKARDLERWSSLNGAEELEVHPMMRLVKGGMEVWERM